MTRILKFDTDFSRRRVKRRITQAIIDAPTYQNRHLLARPRASVALHGATSETSKIENASYSHITAACEIFIWEGEPQIADTDSCSGQSVAAAALRIAKQSSIVIATHDPVDDLNRSRCPPKRVHVPLGADLVRNRALRRLKGSKLLLLAMAAVCGK